MGLFPLNTSRWLRSLTAKNVSAETKGACGWLSIGTPPARIVLLTPSCNEDSSPINLSIPKGCDMPLFAKFKSAYHQELFRI